MYCWYSADLCTAGPRLTDAQFCWSSANWCNAGPLLPALLLFLCWLLYYCSAGPLLTDVLLLPVLCWFTVCTSTADPLLTDRCTVLEFSANWCTAGPLLTDVQYSWSYATDIPLIFCCLIYCWSSAACCPASLLLTDAMCVMCTEITWNIYWVFSKKTANVIEGLLSIQQ